MTFDEFFKTAKNVKSVAEALAGKTDGCSLPSGPGIIFDDLYWIEETENASIYQTIIANTEPAGTPIELAWQLYPLAHELDEMQEALVQRGYYIWNSGGGLWLLRKDLEAGLAIIACDEDSSLPSASDCVLSCVVTDDTPETNELNACIDLSGQSPTRLPSVEAHFQHLFTKARDADQTGSEPTMADKGSLAGAASAQETRSADLASEAWSELINRDDRTSPEDYPDMCLIDRAELEGFLTHATANHAETLKEALTKLLDVAKRNTDDADEWQGAIAQAEAALGNEDSSLDNPSSAPVEPASKPADPSADEAIRFIQGMHLAANHIGDQRNQQICETIMKALRQYTRSSNPIAIRDSACLISMNFKTITIECDEFNEADALFDWLSEGVPELNEIRSKTFEEAADVALQHREIRRHIVNETAQRIHDAILGRIPKSERKPDNA